MIVDDQGAFRQAMRDLVDATPGFCPVGDATCGEEALGAVESLSPDLVLMDVRMPGMGGVEAARILARDRPEVTVVLISVHGREELPPDVVEGRASAAFAPKRALRPGVLRELWQRHGRR